MTEEFRQSALFNGLSEAEIESCLACSKSKITAYEKEEMIFLQTDSPSRLLILLGGTVVVGSDSRDGRRTIVATFDQPGELFGEVFLFLSRQSYGHYAQAVTPVRVLEIPRDFLYHTCGKNCGCHVKLIYNMLSILASKAYFLNQRLQVLSLPTLRGKIARVLLQNVTSDGKAALAMNREELADYLGAARPSVSRELMKMQAEGLLKIEKKDIFVNRAGLRKIL